MNRKLILISGPAGIGKSTTARLLAERMKKSAYVSGDTVSHMSISGREKPWESDSANKLVWKNIKDLSKNFLDYGCDVIVDWIVFWDDIKYHIPNLIEQGIEVRYVILWADEFVHVDRDKQRPKESQMGDRVFILRDEFLMSCAPSHFYLDNTTTDIKNIIEKIQSDSNFIVSHLDEGESIKNHENSNL